MEGGGSGYETTAGGGCGLAKYLSKDCKKNGFSTAYLLISPAVCMHRYRVNDVYQKITTTVFRL